MKSIFYKLSKVSYCFVVWLDLFVVFSETYKTRLILKNKKDITFMFDIEFGTDSGPPYFFYNKFYHDKYRIVVYISEWLSK